MFRPLLWLTLALVPLLILVALTIGSLLRAESQSGQMQREREALLAADALANSLLLLEALREVEQWQAFYQPMAVVSPAQGSVALGSGTLQQRPVPWQVPSPLLAGVEAPLLLHVAVAADGRLSSPQVPDPDQYAFAALYQSALQRAGAAATLRELEAQQLAWDDLRTRLPALPALPAFEDTAQAGSTESARSAGRAEATDGRAMSDDEGSAQAVMALGDSGSSGAFGSRAAVSKNNMQLQRRRQSEAQRVQGYAYELPDEDSDQRLDPAAQATPAQSTPLQVVARSRWVSGAMEAHWLDDHLFFARRVAQQPATQDTEVLQLVLVDGEALMAYLLPAVHSMLPNARLEPAYEGGDFTKDSRLLANVPLRLVVAEQPLAITPATRQLLILLGLAVLLAVVAAVYLLISHILLAERRAAFVSAVTHELRTPLTALRLHADLLSDARVGGDDERRSRSVDTLRHQGARLAALIDNVLDHARLERRRAPRREAVDVRALVAAEQERWRQALSGAGLSLGIEISADLPPLRGDHEALLRILDNLIDNARKYAAHSNESQVVLSAQRQGSQVVIMVRDFGPGLPAGRLPRPFERSAEAAAGHAPGIGLGLSLCRRLARAMGGSLQVSAADPGLQVVIRLPAL